MALSSIAEDRWRADLRTSFDGLSAVPVGDVPLDGRLQTVGLGDVRAFDVSGSAQAVRRSATTARRSQLDHLKVCVQLQGAAEVEQDGDRVALGPGEFALYDLERPYQLSFTGSWRCAVMTLPRASLDLPASTMARVMKRAHPAARGAGRVFAGFLRDCLEPATARGVEGRARIGQAGAALLAGALSDVGDSAADLGDETDAVRVRVVDFVRRHLPDPDLSPAGVARAHAMSPRTLQRLFQPEGRTVAAIIRDLRLAAIRADLADPLLVDRTIAGIGARHGVFDQAWLSHAFRETYGTSPSAFRQETLGR